MLKQNVGRFQIRPTFLLSESLQKKVSDQRSHLYFDVMFIFSVLYIAANQ